MLCGAIMYDGSIMYEIMNLIAPLPSDARLVFISILDIYKKQTAPSARKIMINVNIIYKCAVRSQYKS